MQTDQSKTEGAAAVGSTRLLADCPECGGQHERTGARTDCIRHWKLRAIQAENTVAVEKHYGGILGSELRQWLNAQDINGDSIGTIRRQCFMPWDSSWNSLVREETAEREKSANVELTHSGEKNP